MYLSLFMYLTALGVTPGPNNLLLAASGANYGLRRSLPHMAGVILGFPLMMLLVGSGLGAALLAVPAAQRIIQIAGSLYMLWLAWRVATAHKHTEAEPASEQSRPMTFWQAVAFQWVNGKAWIMAVATPATYSTITDSPVLSNLVITAVTLVIGIPCTTFWALLGTAAAAVLRTEQAIHAFNVTMALLLVASIALIFI